MLKQTIHQVPRWTVPALLGFVLGRAVEARHERAQRRFFHRLAFH